jgi:O-antigen/teichoic acid export membrane protein
MTAPSRQRNQVQSAFLPATTNLGGRVVSGATFTLIGVIFRTTITIGSMAILARLLTPADFGHIAMATIVTELAAVFANFGFGSILIQRTRISRLQIDTMHWCALGLGAFLTLVVFGLSFIASNFFDDEMVGPLLRILSLSFLLEELTMVPRSLLARRMRFKLDFYVQAGMLIARAGTAVVFAMNGFGVWSLVAGALAGYVHQAIGYQALAGYWPRLKFNAVFLRSTWRTNGSYFGTGILFYITSNLDFFLIGKTLGASTLGQYQNARSLSDEVRVRMVQPLQRVLFPAFSAIQNDPDRFRDGILKSGRLLALTFMPVGFGMAAVAPELVRVLYGEQWLPMIPVMQVIAMGTGFSAAASIATPIFNATDRVGLNLRLFGVSAILSVIFMLLGSQWGVMGVSWARLAMVGTSLIFFRIALRLVGMSWRHIWLILGAPCIAAGAMWLVLNLARSLMLSWHLGSALQLAFLIGLGAAVYVVISLAISREHVRIAKEVADKLRKKT